MTLPVILHKPHPPAPLLERLRDGLLARGDLVGIYLYGSLTTGDFSPARSDIDVVVMVQREPDLGLTVLPRAEAALMAGELITKSEAISRLAGFGVPAALAVQIRCRREGQVVPLSLVQRFRRARLARRIMRRGVRRLSRLGPAIPPRDPRPSHP